MQLFVIEIQSLNIISAALLILRALKLTVSGGDWFVLAPTDQTLGTEKPSTC